MLTWRAPWWMYMVAVVYVLTFLFNTRQEFWGPADAGWVPEPRFFKVARVLPGRPMDKAGVHAGDFLVATDGYPLNGAANWFLARAHFERDRPIELQVRRGEQQLALKVVITAPAWQIWNRADRLPAIALSGARFVLLLLAILVGFSRPQQLSARLAALMFAMGAVAEGYPSAGWAAALSHLPAVLAIPLGLATASCLLSSVVWLMFFASFLRPWLSQRLRWVLVVVPLVVFGIPIVASVIAMIYAPSALARPWPELLSAAPVRWIQDVAGVTPLLFLNEFPMYQPIAQTGVLEVWLGITILYFAAGFLILVANYRHLDDRRHQRRASVLLLALAVFAIVVLHNFFVRNWTSWFGSKAPALFSGAGFLGETLLLFFIALYMAHCVLTEDPHGGTTSRVAAANSGVSVDRKAGSAS
jgi:Ca2+/Na+ antiporter